MTTTKRASITLRPTAEQWQWIDEVREYVLREGATAFGEPNFSDRDAVLLLMREGHERARRKIREPAGGAAAETPSPGAGRERLGGTSPPR